MHIDSLIDDLIDRQGGYVHHPADRGGATCWGVTEAVARGEGYHGAMRTLPREVAASIYRRLYWLRPALDRVHARAPDLGAELFDTGVNMGPAIAVAFLQRALNALNRVPPTFRTSRSTARSARSRSKHSMHSSPPEGRGAKRCCSRLSRRSRANATCPWPSAGRQTRPSSTAG